MNKRKRSCRRRSRYYLRTAKIATPSKTSPSRLQGDVFLFFNSRTSSSCLPLTASLTAIVSFFAATVAFKASFSFFRVSFSSLSRADDLFAVSSRSESVLFSSSSAAASERIFANSSTAAAQALITACFGISLAARMPQFGELGAEFGVCAFDIPAGAPRQSCRWARRPASAHRLYGRRPEHLSAAFRRAAAAGAAALASGQRYSCGSTNVAHANRSR